MKITLELDAAHAALLCGTLQRAAEQYPFSPNQRHLFEAVEAALSVEVVSPEDQLARNRQIIKKVKTRGLRKMAVNK